MDRVMRTVDWQEMDELVGDREKGGIVKVGDGGIQGRSRKGKRCTGRG